MLNGLKNKDIDKNCDYVCLSHLRWDFVYQRPQHLMSRFAKKGEARVFYFEEPIYEDTSEHTKIKEVENGVHVITPVLPQNCEDVDSALSSLLKNVISQYNINDYVLWYYTPMALKFSRELKPTVIVYDCMDELSAFKFAPVELQVLETELMQKTDLVFTGGRSLYEAKLGKHKSVHMFPSSIDKEHFRSAMFAQEPEDQKNISSPKIGYCGVIDERMDIALLDKLTKMKPEWNFVMIGPVVKIDPASLPKRDNIFYLGMKSYDELPMYMSGWDAAILPFALNDSTKFISPTKIPEYLAAGKRTVSTPIADVVNPYHDLKLVDIAYTSEEFADALERIINSENSITHNNNYEEVEDSRKLILGIKLETTPDKSVQNTMLNTNAINMTADDYDIKENNRISISEQKSTDSKDDFLEREVWEKRTEEYLADKSWDSTWEKMHSFISDVIHNKI